MSRRYEWYSSYPDAVPSQWRGRTGLGHDGGSVGVSVLVLQTHARLRGVRVVHHLQHQRPARAHLHLPTTAVL
jgi:hypothetical protein